MPVRPASQTTPSERRWTENQSSTRADRPHRALGWYLPRHASAAGRVREPTPSGLTRSEQGGEGVSEDSSGRAARRAEEMKGGQRSGGVVASLRLLLHRAGAGGEAFGVSNQKEEIQREPAKRPCADAGGRMPSNSCGLRIRSGPTSRSHSVISSNLLEQDHP